MNALLHQLQWELRIIFRKRVAWAGLASVLGFELLFFSLIQVPSVRPALVSFFEKLGFSFAENFTALTAAHSVLTHGAGFIASIFSALIAGERIAGDIESGTMRLILCRPVSRLGVWSAKLVASTGYMFLAVLVATLGALAFGCIFEHWGPMVVQLLESGQKVQYSAADGLSLYLRGTLFHAMVAFTWVAIAFLFSCCGARGSTAATGVIALFVADDFLRRMPFLSSVRGWFLGSLQVSWDRIYEPRMDWGWVSEVYGKLGLIDLAVLLVAAWVFARRDFKQ